MNHDLRTQLLIFALQNAVKYASVPKANTVLGTFLGKYPGYRPQARTISVILKEVLSEVEALTPEERTRQLQLLAPDIHEEGQGKKDQRRELSPLEGGEAGVVMRFAPNPSGPLHLGHARAAYLNDYYVRRYGGSYILRIEDTDPRRVEEENYGLLLEDIEWLGLKISDIVYQSDRLEIYYGHCRKLIEIGAAYVCTCEAEQFRELKLGKQPCPCRARTMSDNLELWESMLNGEFYEGMVTVRLKTELGHPDPAMRDFSIFRIVDSPIHPRCDARVYPLMNFSVAVDDHLLKITHVIRGKDHIANTKRQKYLYDYFGWTPPRFYHYGRMSIEGVVLSTSAMKEGIRSGNYSGWDDIHLGTLRAIERRGIRAEAVRNAMIDIGIGETDISFSWENLYSQNKAIVDPVANRYFFVHDPALLSVSGAPEQVARAYRHPNDPNRGFRELHFRRSIVVPRKEIEGKSFLRLKDLFNVQVEWHINEPILTFAGDSLDDARKVKAPIIQWLPAEEQLPCVLRKPEGDLLGSCETGVQDEVGKIIQFERVGFARIDTVSDSGVTAYFAHR